MKIVYKETHLSIDPFDSVETPSLLVLTGTNGSGKTHLLQAIEQKKVVLEGHEDERIVYFNYHNFYLENESIFNAQQIASDRNSAWDFFKQRVKSNVESWKNELVSYQGGYNQIIQICNNTGKYLWNLNQSDLPDQELYNRFRNYKNNIQNLFTQNNDYKDNQHAQGIYILMKHFTYSIDEITEDEFLQLYKPYNFKNDFLPTQLGRIFWDYFIRLRENEFKIFENREKGKSYATLTADEFMKKYGEKPWSVVSTILEKFNALDYKINSPEELSYLDNYQLKLVHTRKNISVEFGHLSSGERVLMALVASIYKIGSDAHFPGILLLDEIDASLHPSMIQNLVDVLNEIFVQKGTQVILVTHSPTTIALAPEESIYVMNKEGKNRIIKKPKNEALNILTEGFATLDEGVKLFDQISRKRLSIITEGKNTKYLEKSLNYFSSQYKSDIEIINGIDGNSGRDQLKVLFDFFSKVLHNNIVVFVWDPDVTYKLTPTSNTIPFIFSKNSQNLRVQSGIENLFEEKHFIPKFYVRKQKSDGGYHEDLDKDEFQHYILGNSSENDFINFKPLFDQINAIFIKTNKISKPPSNEVNSKN